MENKRVLVRTFGLGYVLIFVIANIIGSGVYKKIAPMAAELHSQTWILLAWIAGGIITLFGALSNAEVAGLLADTGGEDMVIFAVFFFYGATTLGVFILRYKMPDAHCPYKVWGYPAVPAAFILFCSVLITNTILTRPREAAIGLALILLGIPVYWLMKKQNT
ncbi:MAG: hypothetical protein AB7V25_03910 [Mangrovibacterium sp.]